MDRPSYGYSAEDPTGGDAAQPQGQPVCPRHPDRVSYVRCKRCDRPACPDCQRPTSVGVLCVDCDRELSRQQASTRPRNAMGASAGDRRPLVTYTVIGLCVALFAGQAISGGIVEQLLIFAPFRALNDLPLGMTAHIRFTALDDGPATASARMIGLIRNRIGFDGLLMTDDITMKALSGSEAERAAASIAAGCDLVLHCNGTLADMAPVVAAAGSMTPDAQRRADAALARRHAPGDGDPGALMAEWRGLTAALA